MNPLTRPGDYKHPVTPSRSAIDATSQAVDAARAARLNGADEDECSRIYGEVYAAALREGAL